MPLLMEENTFWSIFDNFKQTIWSFALYVANIFFFTLNDVFSKSGSSVVSGKERVSSLNCSIGVICICLCEDKLPKNQRYHQPKFLTSKPETPLFEFDASSFELSILTPNLREPLRLSAQLCVTTNLQLLTFNLQLSPSQPLPSHRVCA